MLGTLDWGTRIAIVVVIVTVVGLTITVVRRLRARSR